MMDLLQTLLQMSAKDALNLFSLIIRKRVSVGV